MKRSCVSILFLFMALVLPIVGHSYAKETKQPNSDVNKQIRALKLKLLQHKLMLMNLYRKNRSQQKTINKLKTDFKQLSKRFRVVEAWQKAMKAHILLAKKPNQTASIHFRRVNVHIENGTGKLTKINGAGNLIVGYNKSNSNVTGSHNVIIGTGNKVRQYGSIVQGNGVSILYPFTNRLALPKSLKDRAFCHKPANSALAACSSKHTLFGSKLSNKNKTYKREKELDGKALYAIFPLEVPKGTVAQVRSNANCQLFATNGQLFTGIIQDKRNLRIHPFLGCYVNVFAKDKTQNLYLVMQTGLKVQQEQVKFALKHVEEQHRIYKKNYNQQALFILEQRKTSMLKALFSNQKRGLLPSNTKGFEPIRFQFSIRSVKKAKAGENLSWSSFGSSALQKKAIPELHSCQSILRYFPNSTNGYYQIYRKHKSIRVFCDMKTAGGGWTRFIYHKDPNGLIPISLSTWNGGIQFAADGGIKEWMVKTYTNPNHSSEKKSQFTNAWTMTLASKVLNDRFVHFKYQKPTGCDKHRYNNASFVTKATLVPKSQCKAFHPSHFGRHLWGERKWCGRSDTGWLWMSRCSHGHHLLIVNHGYLYKEGRFQTHISMGPRYDRTGGSFEFFYR